MKWRTSTGLSLALLTGHVTSVWCQEGVIPAGPPVPGAPAAVTPTVPGAAATTGAVGEPRNIWSFLCLTQAQRDAKKERFCRSNVGGLINNTLAPVGALTGGLFGPCCPPFFPSDLLKPADSAEGAAARIKKDEAEMKARRAAVRYLGTVDCRYWPEAQEALINSLRADRSECVRLEAALALGRGCCCTKSTIRALCLTVVGSEEDGNPCEPSPRVRAFAEMALQKCLCCYCDVPKLPPIEVKKDTKEPEKLPPPTADDRDPLPAPVKPKVNGKEGDPLAPVPEKLPQPNPDAAGAANKRPANAATARARITASYYAKVERMTREQVIASARAALDYAAKNPPAVVIPASGVSAGTSLAEIFRTSFSSPSSAGSTETVRNAGVDHAAAVVNEKPVVVSEKPVVVNQTPVLNQTPVVNRKPVVMSERIEDLAPPKTITISTTDLSPASPKPMGVQGTRPSLVPGTVSQTAVKATQVQPAPSKPAELPRTVTGTAYTPPATPAVPQVSRTWAPAVAPVTPKLPPATTQPPTSTLPPAVKLPPVTPTPAKQLPVSAELPATVPAGGSPFMPWNLPAEAAAPKKAAPAPAAAPAVQRLSHSQTAPARPAPAVRPQPAAPKEHLLATFNHSVDLVRREWAATQLGLLNNGGRDAVVVKALLGGAQSDSAPAVRVACLKSLRQLGVTDPQLPAIVKRLLADSDARVRQAAQDVERWLQTGSTRAASPPAPSGTAFRPLGSL